MPTRNEICRREDVPDDLVDPLLVGLVEREVFDPSARRAHEVMVVPREPLGELVAGDGPVVRGRHPCRLENRQRSVQRGHGYGCSDRLGQFGGGLRPWSRVESRDDAPTGRRIPVTGLTQPLFDQSIDRGKVHVMRIRMVLILVNVVLLTAGCAASEDPPARVLTTTSILGDVTGRLLAGSGIEVAVLIPDGASPHDYQLTPQEVAAIAAAEVVVSNGLDLEHEIGDIIATQAEGDVIVAGDFIDTLPIAGGTAPDPHFWMDPVRMQAVVAGISAALADALPDHADGIAANERTVVAELADLDTEVRTTLGAVPAESRRLITNHDGLGYLADRYDLTVVASILPSDQSAPSPADLAAVESLLAELPDPVVFVDTTESDELARLLAEDTGATVVELTIAQVEAGGYVEMMRRTAQQIAGALAP